MKYFIIFLLFSINTFASDYITLSFWDETSLFQTARTRKIFEGDSNIKLAVRYLEKKGINYAFDDYGFIYIGDKIRFDDSDTLHYWCVTVNGTAADAYAVAEEDSEISWRYVSITKFIPLDRNTFCNSSKSK